MSHTPYDGDVLATFATTLYRNAAWHTFKQSVRGLFLGGIIGVGIVALFGALDSQTKPDALAFFALCLVSVGSLVGLVGGYVLGRSQSFSMRFRAQTVLCQREIERHLKALVAVHSPAPLAPAPTPPPG